MTAIATISIMITRLCCEIPLENSLGLRHALLARMNFRKRLSNHATGPVINMKAKTAWLSISKAGFDE
jgi:hypothetical protein